MGTVRHLRRSRRQWDRVAGDGHSRVICGFLILHVLDQVAQGQVDVIEVVAPIGAE
jgi:hypothetical protein